MNQKPRVKPLSPPECCGLLSTAAEDGHVFLVDLFEPKTLTYHYYSKNPTTDLD